MFLFEGSFGNILHAGDCRLTPECLQNLPEKFTARRGEAPACQLDFVFLDCTFGKSLMKIPSKQSALQQVTNCIWKHPDVPTVYLTCDLLGQEEILIHVSQTFGSKIYVDKTKHPDFYQALKLIAPEIISKDPSSRFQLFEGFPKLYERAEKKLSEARENLQAEPLIIRPSAQWYAHEETELTVTERKILEKSNIPVKDRFGVWHVCYSMHSSRQELEWALELLVPKWVVSTTPECRAMELEYVKKNCFSSQASDARLWKLLDFTVEASSKAAVLAVNSSSSFVEAITNASSGESDLELPKVLPKNKRILTLSPLSKRPPITLFGRARLGYHSCISVEKMNSTSVNGCRGVVTNEMDQNLPPRGDDVENKAEPLTDKDKEADAVEIKFDISREDIVTCRSVSYSSTGSSNGFSGNPLPCDDDVENNAEHLTDNEKEVDAAEIKSDLSREDTVICSRSVSYSSYSSTGSSKGFSDNLRKLYRSMNVPVPRPLPSLVELMKGNKRAKRLFEL